MATILIVNIQFYNAESIELQKYCLNIAPSSLYTKQQSVILLNLKWDHTPLFSKPSSGFFYRLKQRFSAVILLPGNIWQCLETFLVFILGAGYCNLIRGQRYYQTRNKTLGDTKSNSLAKTCKPLGDLSIVPNNHYSNSSLIILPPLLYTRYTGLAFCSIISQKGYHPRTFALLFLCLETLSMHLNMVYSFPPSMSLLKCHLFNKDLSAHKLSTFSLSCA